MKKMLLIALLVIAPAVFAQDEEAAIKKSIQTFFEGMYARDTAMIKSVCMDGLVLQTVTLHNKENTFSMEGLSVFYKQISEIPKGISFEEHITDYKIQFDGGIAQVWAPYRFYVGTSLSHYGNDAFTLVKDKAKWKISYIIDTRRIAEMK